MRQAILQCPKGQGKSTLLAALAVWATFDKSETGQPEVPIVATTVQQAKSSVFDTAAWMVRSEPELERRANVFTADNSSRIVANNACGGGKCFPKANEIEGLQGLDPSFAIMDEIGFQPWDSWEALVKASGKRRTSLIVAIGTPGLDKEKSALWQIRTTWLDGIRPPGVSFTEYSAPDGCDIQDEANWHRANPALVAGFQYIDALRIAAASAVGGKEASFRTYHLGQWVDGQDCWLGPDGDRIWSALRSDYQLIPHEVTYVGLDVGLTEDTTACVVGQFTPDGVLHTECKIWRPTENNTVDLADITAHLYDLDRTYKVAEFVYDKKLFELPAQMLADDGLNMVEFSQSPERMTPACREIYAAIMRGEISHNGDEQYKRQILNAMPRLQRDGFTLEKRKSRGKIDAAIALTLMHARAQRPEKPLPTFVAL